jgi:hypothetical protein
VGDDHDPVNGLVADSLRERRTQLVNTEPPVVVIQNRREAARAQIQLEPQVRI